MSFQPDASFLHHLADIADGETLPRFRRDLVVETKFKPDCSFDPVTEADRRAEQALRMEIARIFPEHGILGEEFGGVGNSRYQWVLDPVDGTRPFICGLPVWGTLIGFMADGRATMGMMSQPYIGERFWADEHGAWSCRKGGEPTRLRTRDVGSLSQAILHMTSPYLADTPLKDGIDRLISRTRMVRYGGECYATAMLAAGLIDICLEPSLQPYDIVALVPIIEQAGGIVTRFDGGRPEAGGAILASANPRLHEELLREIGRAK